MLVGAGRRHGAEVCRQGRSGCTPSLGSHCARLPAQSVSASSGLEIRQPAIGRILQGNSDPVTRYAAFHVLAAHSPLPLDSAMGYFRSSGYQSMSTLKQPLLLALSSHARAHTHTQAHTHTHTGKLTDRQTHTLSWSQTHTHTVVQYCSR